MSSLLRTGAPLALLQPFLRHVRNHFVNAAVGCLEVRI